MLKRKIMDKNKLETTHNEIFPAGTTFCVDGDLGTDIVAFESVGINDKDLTTVFDNDGTEIELTGTRTSFGLENAAHFLITKPVTTNDVGIYVIE